MSTRKKRRWQRKGAQVKEKKIPGTRRERRVISALVLEKEVAESEKLHVARKTALYAAP